MSFPSDEFGFISFDDLSSSIEGVDLLDIEAKGDFSGGLLHCSAKAKFTDTHLVALFTDYKCACGQTNSVGNGYAIRRVHHSRNECIEYQSIMPSAIPQYDDLPRDVHTYELTSPFCMSCIEGFL